MGTIRTAALIVLTISFFTFVAFFGRLPALRNTPVGSLHRLIWIYIPSGFRSLDRRLSGGRLSAWTLRTAHTLWNDRHPIVMIFFILLLSVSEILFLPPAWPLLSTTRRLTSIILLTLPYLFLYLSASTDPGYINPTNLSQNLTIYPYDYTLFYPGQKCRTCQILKPARSKHCSICKRCISKLDHHCIFINNCVGHGNQHYFLLLLLTTAILTSYASYVGVTTMSEEVKKLAPSWTLRGTGLTWTQYWNVIAWILQEHTRIGAVTLLCLMITPLIIGLFVYHIYLIYAGTTTNESMKWQDWQAEMSDGYVFKRSLPLNRVKDVNEAKQTTWPVQSQQILLRTEDGAPPTGSEAVGVGAWERVWKLRDVENLYDLGFWDNMVDVFWPSSGVMER